LVDFVLVFDFGAFAMLKLHFAAFANLGLVQVLEGENWSASALLRRRPK